MSRQTGHAPEKMPYSGGAWLTNLALLSSSGDPLVFVQSTLSIA